MRPPRCLGAWPEDRNRDGGKGVRDVMRGEVGERCNGEGEV